MAKVASQPVSATTPDWAREAYVRSDWQPAKRVIAAMRRYGRWKARGGLGAAIVCRVATVQHRFWSAVAGCDIPINANIAGGLLLPHPNGVVVHPDVTVGPNCLLMQQTTLGSGGKIPGVPKLGGHVDVGAGAKVLGGVTVGDHARIGANAVVLCDVPPGATAVGIPARIIPARDAAAPEAAESPAVPRPSRAKASPTIGTA